VSDWQHRAEDPDGPGTTYVPITGMDIEQNTVTDVGGDGIFVSNADHARVAYNTINQYNMRSTDYNIGAVAWNSDGTMFEHNTVTRGKYPAIAFAVEGADVANVIQYNYSQDNGGGFLYICQEPGLTTKDAVVRYNISQNDAAGAQDFGLISTYCAGATNLRIYNNTFYAPNTPSLVDAFQANDITLQNNIFVGEPTGSVMQDPYSSYQSNLYENVSTKPTNSAQDLTGDPLLVAPGTATGPCNATGYYLKSGSPALHTGTPVTGDAYADFFGNPIPYVPNIGAYQGNPPA
jgi:hypothetical protein